MNNCPTKISTVDCEIETILQQIEPIQYDNNNLIVSSPLSVENTVTITDQSLTILNNVLELPENTTIDGQPLDQVPYTGDILELPQETTIDGFSLFTTSYYSFFNSSIQNASGNYIIGSTYTGSASNYIKFPFFVPENCILTSLIFSFAVASTSPSTISNATAFIDIVDPVGTITYTGISVSIPYCPRGSKYYANKYFQYPLTKGYSVGIRFTYDGTAGSCSQFATLGYKFLL
jgi:hypothetical protein